MRPEPPNLFRVVEWTGPTFTDRVEIGLYSYEEAQSVADSLSWSSVYAANGDRVFHKNPGGKLEPWGGRAVAVTALAGLGTPKSSGQYGRRR